MLEVTFELFESLARRKLDLQEPAKASYSNILKVENIFINQEINFAKKV